MPQLQELPTSAQDLLEFIDGHSDFAFEIQVLNILMDYGFACEHSGTYKNPVTEKPREFDILATQRFGRRFLRLAIECKNLRENFPLLISCMPRTPQEAFHEILFSFSLNQIPSNKRTSPYFLSRSLRSKNISIDGDDTFYQKDEFVGKSCEQVGRKLAGNQKNNSSKSVF